MMIKRVLDVIDKPNRAVFGSRRKRVRATSSKRGGLLIMAMILLAVAMILITSAFAISASSRGRFYSYARDDQAKLTALATAKAIGDAIDNADLKDEEIEAFATNNVTVNFSGTAAPGLGQTTAHFYHPGGNTDRIGIDVVTEIDVPSIDGLARYKVTLILETKPPEPLPTQGFGNMVTVGADGSSNLMPMMRVGGGAPSGASNFVVAHGDAYIAPGGLQIFDSSMVFTGVLKVGANTNFTNDLILYGDNARYDTTSGGSFNVAGHALALGETGASPVFTTPLSGGGGNSIAGGFYFYKKDAQITANWNVLPAGEGYVADQDAILNFSANWYYPSFPIYRAHESASVSSFNTTYPVNDSAPIVQTLRDAAAFYLSPTVRSHLDRKLPTTAEAAASGILPLTTGPAVRASTAQDITAALATGGDFGPGTYYIDVSAAKNLGSTGWSASSTEIRFDLTSGNVMLYLIGGSKLTIGYGAIRFMNGGTNVGVMGLLDGTDIEMIPTWNGAFDTGIFGAPRTSNSGTTSYIPGSKPFLYIYGLGGNTIYAKQHCVLEGYIGLYGPDGTLKVENGPKFYGRIEAMHIIYVSGDPFVAPYCPSPYEDGSATEERIPVVSKYRVLGYVTSLA